MTCFVAFLFIFIASKSIKPIKDSNDVGWNWWKHLMFCYDTNERERERERENGELEEAIMKGLKGETSTFKIIILIWYTLKKLKLKLNIWDGMKWTKFISGVRQMHFTFSLNKNLGEVWKDAFYYLTTTPMR